MANVWILCQVRRTGAWNTGGLAHTGPAQVEAGPEDELILTGVFRQRVQF